MSNTESDWTLSREQILCYIDRYRDNQKEAMPFVQAYQMADWIMGHLRVDIKHVGWKRSFIANGAYVASMPWQRRKADINTRTWSITDEFLQWEVSLGGVEQSYLKFRAEDCNVLDMGQRPLWVYHSHTQVESHLTEGFPKNHVRLPLQSMDLVMCHTWRSPK